MRPIPIDNILGATFGRVTPIEELPPKVYTSKKRSRLFRCICQCGSAVVTTLAHLRKGHTRSCGCLRVKNPDLEGKKFNSLLVVKEIPAIYRKNGRQRIRRVLVKCDCGTMTELDAHWVFSGLWKSCGCRLRKRGNESPAFRGTGEIPSTYWGALRASATDRNIPFNITAQEAWNLFLTQKRKCALSGESISFNRKPIGTASLDRKDSAGPYSIENVQWIQKDINYMKMDLPQDRFIQLCRQIAEYNNK